MNSTGQNGKPEPTRIFAAVIAVKGDWQFLAKTGHLTRNWAAVQTCHRCLATNLGDNNFRDMNHDAEWRSTEASAPDPWDPDAPPVWKDLPSFGAKMLKIDVMHCWHLGIGRLFCGGAIRIMCMHGLFGEKPLASQLVRAWADFDAWCAEAKHSPALTSFVCLNTKSRRKDVELHCKASDTTILMGWLTHKLQGEAGKNELFCTLATCAWTWDTALRRLSRGQVFLSAPEAADISLQLDTALLSYAWLSRWALCNRYRFFRIRPKMHMLAHLASDLRPGTRTEIFNAMCFSTFGDEDFVGKVSRLSRRCHPFQAAERTLQRYLLGLMRPQRGQDKNLPMAGPTTVQLAQVHAEFEVNLLSCCIGMLVMAAGCGVRLLCNWRRRMLSLVPTYPVLFWHCLGGGRQTRSWS